MDLASLVPIVLQLSIALIVVAITAWAATRLVLPVAVNSAAARLMPAAKCRKGVRVTSSSGSARRVVPVIRSARRCRRLCCRQRATA